jgi:hypothetical protein
MWMRCFAFIVALAKLVCPVENALELKRTKISHTPVRSGAWNKTLERLASPVEMTKELKAKGFSGQEAWRLASFELLD